MWQQILPGLRMKLFLTVLTGRDLSAGDDRHLPGCCFRSRRTEA